jgi:hypothetical protein
MKNVLRNRLLDFSYIYNSVITVLLLSVKSNHVKFDWKRNLVIAFSFDLHVLMNILFNSSLAYSLYSLVVKHTNHSFIFSHICCVNVYSVSKQNTLFYEDEDKMKTHSFSSHQKESIPYSTYIIFSF